MDDSSFENGAIRPESFKAPELIVVDIPEPKEPEDGKVPEGLSGDPSVESPFSGEKTGHEETQELTSEMLMVNEKTAEKAVDVVIDDKQILKPEKKSGRYIGQGVEARVYAVDIDGEQCVVKEYLNPNIQDQREYVARLQKIQQQMKEKRFENFAPIVAIEKSGVMYVVQKRFDVEGDMAEMNKLLSKNGLAISDIDQNVGEYRDQKGKDHPVLLDFTGVGPARK